MARLSREILSQLPPEVITPQYNKSEITPGIVHFGPSNFARAHLAVYVQRLLNQGHRDCGIIAVSPKLSSVFSQVNSSQEPKNQTIERRDILAAQDQLYSVWSRGAKGDELTIVDSFVDLLIGPNDVGRVIDTMAHPDTKLVTMTVTQNGYYYTPNGHLDFDHPDIKESLKDVDNPRATVAYIVRALEKRMEAGMPSFGVMSLDNFEANSTILRRTVLAYAGEHSRDLRDWIAKNTTFHSTMVDRIVPQLDSNVIEQIEERYGFRDEWPLVTEPYMDLVIECKYGRPAFPFDKAGARYVEDVAPYELAKLRMLNGVHMGLGVVGRLLGETHADEALAAKELKKFADGFMTQAAGTLHPLDGADYNSYKADIFDRLENPHLHDELKRLARNGTEKARTRFISPLRDAYARDLPRDHIVMACAAWIKYVSFANDDPTLDHDKDGCYHIADAKAYEIGLVGLSKKLNGDITPILSLPIWGGLEGNPKFAEELKSAYKRLTTNGAGNDLSVVAKPFGPQ